MENIHHPLYVHFLTCHTWCHNKEPPNATKTHNGALGSCREIYTLIGKLFIFSCNFEIFYWLGLVYFVIGPFDLVSFLLHLQCKKRKKPLIFLLLMNNTFTLKPSIPIFRQKHKERHNKKNSAQGKSNTHATISSISEEKSNTLEHIKTPPIRSLIKLLKKASIWDKPQWSLSKHDLCHKYQTPLLPLASSINEINNRTSINTKYDHLLTENESPSKMDECRNKSSVSDLYAFNEKIFQLTLKKIDRMRIDRSYQSEYRYVILKHIYEQTLLRRAHYTRLLEGNDHHEREFSKRLHTNQDVE